MSESRLSAPQAEARPAPDGRAIAAQRLIGLGLAALIVGSWLALHVAAVFLLDPAAMPLAATATIILVQTWLSVGLFIVAHDAMHGSLAPFWPGVNRWVGRVALIFYAGFSYDRLLPSHFAHHRHAGTAGDPDFDEAHPSAFLPWFATFMRRYVGWRELAAQTAISMTYFFAFGVAFANLLLFWALPALLAAVQLFFFGTYRPHRHDGEPFADRHNSRSDDLPVWASLLTCFHFGYHHEHHDSPRTPWWRLPRYRRERG